MAKIKKQPKKNSKKQTLQNNKFKYVAIIATILIILGFAANQILNNPKNQLLPMDIKSASEDFKNSVSKLTEEDKKLLMEYMLRKNLAKAFNKEINSKAVTIGDAIQEQQDFQQERAVSESSQASLKEDAEKKAVLLSKQFENMVTIELLKKGLSRVSYRDYITLELAINNKGNKDIVGIKGVASFKDIFGDVIKNVNFSYDDGVKAGETKTWKGSIEYNQFISEDIDLAAVDLDKVKFEFAPEIVIFTDGTKIDFTQ